MGAEAQFLIEIEQESYTEAVVNMPGKIQQRAPLSTVYAICLSIILIYAQSVKELINIYIIIINKVMIEKNAFLAVLAY